ncbi:polycystin-1-like [Pseudophryne corroboree]|uniref:polycystin-1-like n=1 Tax=Pseudophryne corroboree TaxID=495146 RepID=UPI0030820CCD
MVICSSVRRSPPSKLTGQSADHHVSCVRGPTDLVLHYSLVTPDPLPSDGCLALCFRYGYSYYSRDDLQRCLCGFTTTDHNDTCSGVCSRNGKYNNCNKNIIQDLHTVQVSVSLSASSYYSVFQSAEFYALASVPVTHYMWEYSDGSKPVITTLGVTSHKSSLPGQYTVKVKAEGQDPAAEFTVITAVPVDRAELHCPEVVQTGQNLEVWLEINQGTNLQIVYGVQQPDGQHLTDDSSCPRGGRIFQGNLHCYWLNQVKESLVNARRRCASIPGGKLAYITSVDQLTFIQETFSGNSPVWLNISQPLKQDDGSTLTVPSSDGQEIAQECTRLPLIPGQIYQRSSCLVKAPSVCECRAGVHLPDVPVYVVGNPVFDDIDTENATLLPVLEDPQSDIEIMIFPGLWFSHSGSLLALDLGVHPLQYELQARVQILRPFCSPELHLLPPGCELMKSPFATCYPQPLCNTTGGCPSGKQWCPLTENCLRLDHPCSTYSSKDYPYPPRYIGSPPLYSPVADMLLHFSPSNKRRNIQVLLSHLSHSVYPDDILSIQHTGGRGSFLHCTSSSDSAWRQSYISMVHRGWLTESLLIDSDSWVDDVVCDLHVIYGSELRSLVVSPLLWGFHGVGTYTVSAVLNNEISSTVASCEVTVQSPITDLQFLYPTHCNDSLHVATQDPSLVVIGARSIPPVHVQWSTTIQSGESMMQQECPLAVVSLLPICHTRPLDLMFAWMELYIDNPQTITLSVILTNDISVKNLTMQIQSHDAIQGLRILSHGPYNFQLNQTRIFTAELTHGSSVTFTWTMDNNEEFSYKGPSYVVTFRTPGVFLLKVLAQNPVSSQDVDMVINVHGIFQPHNAELIVFSTFLLVSEAQEMCFQFQLERSSTVNISWNFGDGSPLLNRSVSVPNDVQHLQISTEPLITLNMTESHIYTQEGQYEVKVIAYNSDSEFTRSVVLKAVLPLTSMILRVDHSSPELQKSALFSTLCLPSHFAVTVTWNFGDKSEVVQSSDLQITHVYTSFGTYNVTATASNGRSHVTRTLMITIEQQIEGIQVLSNGPTELGTETIVTCSLTQGTNVTWSFYMGDGKSYINQSDAQVKHRYNQQGNYTVTVIGRNALSSVSKSLIVQICRMQITNIVPAVVTPLISTQFTAYLTLPSTLLRFSWDLGDGSPPIIVHGKADVVHTYLSAGNYTLKLLVSGDVGSDVYNRVITVEEKIVTVTLNASTTVANVSQPVLFHAMVQPLPDHHHQYWFQWDFCLGMLPIHTSSPDVSWTYMHEGEYNVTVSVWNHVSQHQVQCYLTVQQPILSVTIEHSGGDMIPRGVQKTFIAKITPDISAQFIWYFGESSFSYIEQNVTHTFHVSGNITVTVHAKNNVSHSKASITLYVQSPITALSLSADLVLAKSNQVISFLASLSNGDAVQYFWSLCELCPYLSGPSNMSHIFSDPGIFMVRVQAENKVSSAQAFVIVEVQEQVQGVSIWQENTQVNGFAGFSEPLTLTAHVVKGSNLTYHWVLKPGQWESQNASITFHPSALGELFAEVWVENALGSVCAQSRLQILERISNVSIQSSVGVAPLGTPVSLTVLVQSGTGMQYTWDLGEGSSVHTSQNQTFTLKYFTPGSKVITVTVSNALSSNTVSTELTVQEAVSNINIDIQGAFNFQVVMSHKTVLLCGFAELGTELMWEWIVSGINGDSKYSTQIVSHTFTEPGQYWLQLQVWNSVSNANISHMLLVQDIVTGFIVVTERSNTCTGQEVNFCYSVQSGTNVTFTMTVPQLNLSQVHLKKCGHVNFNFSGMYEVLAYAFNNVSRANFNFSIHVLETVRGLKVLSLPSAWPVRQSLYLNATLEVGHLSSFDWTFKQLGQAEHSLTGHRVELTPLEEGTLHILLNVSNLCSFSSLVSSMIIQAPVTSVYLKSNSKEVFLSQCITFTAVISDGSDLQFHWTFEDSEKNLTGVERSVEHCFNNAGIFVIQVTVFNLVSLVHANTTVIIRSLNCEQPHVWLVESPPVVYPAFGASFEVIVDLKGCTKYRAIYLWQLYKGSVCYDKILDLPKLDTSNTLLAIPGGNLKIGMHCLLFTIRLQGTPLSNKVIHRFEVKHSLLVARIHGGSKQTWPAETDLILDGTESYDPDVHEGQQETDIAYEWRSESLENENYSCSLPSLPGLSKISIIGSALCANTSYIFTLSVRKPGRELATTKQIVTLHIGPVFPVYVQCISCYLSTSSQISHRVPVVLRGECGTCNNDTLFIWSATDSNGHFLALDMHTTTTGPTTRELVIRKGTLPNNLSYTFTLHVTHQKEPGWGEGRIVLQPNNPPTGGHCSLAPQSTILWHETPLEYNCTGWSNPDMGMQLFYVLSAQRCSAVGCQKLYLYRGLRSWHSVRAPAGGDGGVITVYMEVEDMQGDRTLAINRLHFPFSPPLYSSLSVLMPALSRGISRTQWLWNHSESLLEHLQLVSDTPLVLQLALEMITALNLDNNTTDREHNYHVQIRNNVTQAVSSVNLSSLWEVAAVSAALTQCMDPHEMDTAIWLKVLEVTEKMIHVLTVEGDRGQRAENDIQENILTLLGGALTSSYSEDLSLFAFNLARTLTVSLGRSRMIGEEPLIIHVPGVKIQATRILPQHLLYSTPSDLSQDSKLHVLPSTLLGHHELLQVTIELDNNPFPDGLLPNMSVTSQLVALEFTSLRGDSVPVKDLPAGSAIQLRMPVRKEVILTPTSVFLPPRGSANITVTTELAHRSAGTHLYIDITTMNGSDWSLENSPTLLISYGPIHSTNQSVRKRIYMYNLTLGAQDRQNISLLLPSKWSWPVSLLEYQVNITSLLSINSVTASVSLFSSLCQYFHMTSHRWRTNGMTPSNASQPHQAVCHTRHLTLFGASVFVPLHHLVLLPPDPQQWTLVVTCCLVLLSLYVLLVLISHKLDHLDVSRVGIIPLCGPQGQYRYWVLVKTGWRRGAGTTAHVGICLYGLNQSGARDLDNRGGFNTGSIDIFQVETDSNLGEIWKIRVWHDNTGLDPTWFLQYVAVWDKQTDFLYFFLLNDWLSVENERNGGKVEKEILATCPQELNSFSQVFPAQLRLGVTDWHLWLSVWLRPARSRFTRIQRVTSCALTLHLYMAACSLWYGAVGVQGNSYRLGCQSLLTWQSVFVGILVCLIVLPLQLLVTFLFRETRSLVFVDDLATSTSSADEELHVDTSSMLSIPGKADSLLDITSLSCRSITSSKFAFDIGKDFCWHTGSSQPIWISSCDSLYDAQYDIPSESAFGFMQPMCKKNDYDHCRLQSACSSGDDLLSLSEESSCSPLFTLSEENLLQSIVADTHVWKLTEESDSGRFSSHQDLGSPSTESGYSLMFEDDNCYVTGCCSENNQWDRARRGSYSSSLVSDGTSNDSELQDRWDSSSVSPSPFTTCIGVRWRPLGWLFPSWMLWLVYSVSFILLSGCIAATILYISSLSEHGLLLWLISTTCALLTSAFLLEPFKVVLLSLYYALCRPPVLSEGLGLVEEPVVKKISDHSNKVRAPGGFSLQQAKQEARRVRALRTMIKSCTGYMVFFLLVLLMNFQSSFHDNNNRLLHTAIKQSVTRAAAGAEMNFTTIRSISDLWHWLDSTLPDHLYSNPRLTLLGSPRLCQLNVLPLSSSGWFPILHSQSDSLKKMPLSSSATGWVYPEICSNFTLGPNFTHEHDHSGCQQNPCQELGNTLEKMQKTIRALNNINWIHQNVLQLEITQYHKDVRLHISSVLQLDLSPHGISPSRLSILPFHIQELRHGLNLPMALALSLLCAALCFLCPELAAMVNARYVNSTSSPHWTRILIGLVSAATGIVHVARICLTKHRMDQFQAKPWSFISLYDIALLSRTQAALSATLLLLVMLKVAQQLRFVRRWAVFGKTLQKLRVELLGFVFPMTILTLAFIHCMSVVSYVILPMSNVLCSPLFSLLRGGSSLQCILQSCSLLGWCLGLVRSLLVVWRGLLFGAILNIFRTIKAESYRPALEPQDHEMIDFLVKRFKLWLGVSKVKEYRHTVKFEGLESYSTCTSLACSRAQSATVLSTDFSSFPHEVLVSPTSPRPILSPGLAVEHLPTAVSDLLDRMDKVTVVLKEIRVLEQKLKLWQKNQQSHKVPHKEISSTTSGTYRQLLPRTYSTFSESALTHIKSKSKSDSFSRRAAPDSAGLPVNTASAGLHKTRLTTRRPHSHERTGVHKQNEDPILPIPRKRRAWDLEKPGDTML